MACSDAAAEIRQDNHAARLAQLLFVEKLPYYWTWLPMKLGYDTYDEGLAVFSRRLITAVDAYRISSSDSYKYWKTRWMLGIQTDEPEQGWFYTVHMGWWNDEEEPFAGQWVRLEEHLRTTGASDGQIWLMGDFNSRDDVRDEGYDLICRSGWKDTWQLAVTKDDGITAGTDIDGWRDQSAEPAGTDRKNARRNGMRIDYIWSNRPAAIESSRVVCDGTTYPVVSDHCGVLIQTKQQ